MSLRHPLSASLAQTACIEALEARRLLALVASAGYPVGASPQAVVTGDVNNDGRLDLVTANAGDNTVSVLLGNANGTFQPAIFSATGIPTDRSLQSLAVGDFNEDGMLDLATGNHNYYGDGGHGVSILMGNGNGTFDPAVSMIDGSGMALWYVATGNLNGDDKVDLVVTFSPHVDRMAMSGVYVLLGRGDGTFAGAAVPQPFSDSSQPNYAPVLADFNRDGKTDVGVPTGWGFEAVVEIHLNNGDGSLARPLKAVAYSSGAWIETVAATVGDFNGDNKLDLVALSANDSSASLGRASLLLGKGDGTFQPWKPLKAWGAPGDFNSDGALDLNEWGNYVFLGKGDGSFATPPRHDEGFYAPYSDVVVADFNGDARLDAAATDMYSNTVSVLLNDGAWTTKTYVGPTSGGNWSTAANWSPGGVPTSNDVVTISGKSVNLAASTTVRGVDLLGGAMLNVGAAGNRVLRTSSLTITGSGSTLNLNDNDLILDYSGVSPVGLWNGDAYDGVTGMIQSGRLISSLASGTLKNLGVAEAREVLGITGPQTATFAGQALDSTAVLVKFTWGGDATLDGKINIDDYGRIDGSVAQSGVVFGWFNGDFNYDGKINIDDYGIIDSNISAQGELLLGADSATVAAPLSSSGVTLQRWVVAAPSVWPFFPAIDDDKKERLEAIDGPGDDLWA